MRTFEYFRSAVLDGAVECGEELPRLEDDGRPEINQSHAESVVNDHILVLHRSTSLNFKGRRSVNKFFELQIRKFADLNSFFDLRTFRK
jgi:hypothetical protein